MLQAWVVGVSELAGLLCAIPKVRFTGSGKGVKLALIMKLSLCELWLCCFGQGTVGLLSLLAQTRTSSTPVCSRS